MKKKNQFGYLVALSLAAVSFTFGFNSCGSKSSSESTEETSKVSQEDFSKTQPVESGLYDADYYDITGKNDRKGRFDGRIYFSLSPEMSAFYVFENGNRTKINYLTVLDTPFEKGDSGIYKATDNKNLPVSLSTDSTMYILDFQHQGQDVKITFNPKPRHTGSAVEILEKIKQQRDKK